MTNQSLPFNFIVITVGQPKIKEMVFV